MVMPPKLREPPVLLARLLTEDSPEAKNFRLNIRSYNNLLSFASKGISGKLYVHGMHIKCKYCNERLYIYDVLVICYTILYCIVLLVLYFESTLTRTWGQCGKAARPSTLQDNWTNVSQPSKYLPQ